MTVNEFQDLIQATLNDMCPDLKMDVCCNRGQPWVQYCMGHIAYSFPIDQESFGSTIDPKLLIKRLREELLGTLYKTKTMIEQSIKEIE